MGTPSGSGVLIEGGAPKAFYMRLFNPAGHAWFQRRDYFDDVFVYPGYDLQDPEQGVVIVTRHKPYAPPSETWINTPTRAGYVEIVGAEGDCLLLASEQGHTFLFDVSGERFTSSCSVVSSTVTPIPTRPTGTLPPELLSDDVPDDPAKAFIFDRDVDSVLSFYINPLGDEDWFMFYLGSTADVEVVLSHPGGDYGLYVYRSNGELEEWNDETRSQTKKAVKLHDAYPCFYYVRVVGLEGTYDDDIPYQLEFRTK